MKFCYLKLQDDKIVSGEMFAENNKEYVLKNAKLRENKDSHGVSIKNNRVPKLAVVNAMFVDREDCYEEKRLSNKEKWSIEMGSLISCTLDSMLNFNNEEDLSMVSDRIISNIMENKILSEYIPE